MLLHQDGKIKGTDEKELWNENLMHLGKNRAEQMRTAFLKYPEVIVRSFEDDRL